MFQLFPPPGQQTLKPFDLIVGNGSEWETHFFRADQSDQSDQSDNLTVGHLSRFGHYVPSDLNFAWRGADFSHGTYADRHQIY